MWVWVLSLSALCRLASLRHGTARLLLSRNSLLCYQVSSGSLYKNKNPKCCSHQVLIHVTIFTWYFYYFCACQPSHTLSDLSGEVSGTPLVLIVGLWAATDSLWKVLESTKSQCLKDNCWGTLTNLSVSFMKPTEYLKVYVWRGWFTQLYPRVLGRQIL